jgi:nitrite reductase/ring-hydroxylating ferredoxin subunit
MGILQSVLYGNLQGEDANHVTSSTPAELNTKPPTATQCLVGKSDEVPERGRLVVDAGGKTIDVYRLDGALYAYENICPHQGGPVCEGLIVPRVLELIDNARVSLGNKFDDNSLHIACPWHGFEYDIRTGRHEGGANFSLKRVSVLEKDGDVYVTL